MAHTYHVSYSVNSETASLLPRRHGKKSPQYLAALSVCTGALAAGAALGWTGNISEDMKELTYNGIQINDGSLGWIGSLSTLGATMACFPMGSLCDLLGRRIAMLLLTIPFMFGWLLIIFANSLMMLYIGRFLTGMAGCAFCVSAPIYTSEIAEKEIRGAVGSYFELLFTTGVLFAYIIPMFVGLKAHTVIMATLPLLFLVIMWFQPESPVYLLRENKHDEARRVLVRLRGPVYDVDAEILNIKNFSQEEKNNNVSIFESMKKKGTQKAALVCFSLMFFQQACGITAFMFYCDTIFETAGSDIDPKVSTIIIGAVSVAATLLSSIVVDRLGKRFLLFNSNLFMAISGTILGVFFTLQERHLVDEGIISNLGFVPITALSIFVTVFSLGIGPIPWVLSAELFPPEIKSFGTGAATTINWFTGFLVTKFYLDIKDNIGGDVTFYIFSTVAFVGTIFTYYYVPETKGKTLEQIQKELNHREPHEREKSNSYRIIITH